MKLIDENGRIFGKFNIIDFVIVLIIVAMIVGLGFKLFVQKNTDVKEQEFDIKSTEVTFLVERIPSDVKNDIQIGDYLIINNQITDAEVIKVESTNSKVTTYDDQGTLKVVENPLLHDLRISVKLDANVSDSSVIFMDQTLKSNIDFVVETKSFYANSKVIKVVFAD